MKAKYYFENEHSEFCYPKEHFIGQMKIEKRNEMIVFEAVPIKSIETGYMFCCKINSSGDKGNCGNMCKNYSPRNGKSGICANQGRLFEKGEKVTLKLK